MQSMQPVEAMESMDATHSMNGGAVGHLYIQTNEIHNCVVHYRRSGNGAIEEVARVSTGGAGSGGYNPIINRESTPNPFEGARSVILSRDNRFLFATNAGDNSVSSFTVDDQGRLTLVDVKRTGNVVPGRAGARSRWRTTPPAGRSTCSTRSAPTTFACSRSTTTVALRRGRSATR